MPSIWVFSPQSAQAFPLKATEASRKGLHFTAANGTVIHNYGQRDVNGYAGDWCSISHAAHIADVKRNLASAMRIMNAGNRIVLDE